MVSWSKYGRNKLRIYFLSAVIDMFIDADVKWRQVLELFVFLILGCIISVGVVDPGTPIQAITAGFGWTGILSSMKQ